MAIALVQSNHAASAQSGSTAALSFAGASGGGSMLSLHGSMVLNAGDHISSVTDDAGNTWTVSTSATTSQNPPIGWVPSGTVFASFCAWTLNAAPANTITLHMAGATLSFWNVVIAEWSGVGSFDTSAASGGTAGGGLSLSQGLTLSGSGEMVLLATDVSSQWSAGPAQGTAFGSGGSPFEMYALSQSGSQTYTWSGASSSSDTCTVAVAAFKPPGGTSHTATAALTVTPSFSAARTPGRYRTGALTVTPSFSAARTRGRYRTGTLTVSPSFSAARTRGHYRSGSLTAVPGFSAGRQHGHARTASLLVAPASAAGRVAGRHRSGALTVTLSFRAVPSGGAAAALVLFSFGDARWAWAFGAARNQ